MPKKACCCTQPAPEENSCCRPIYQGCVGKKYTFEVLFKAKYPCLQGSWGNWTDQLYECISNNSIKHSIPGNTETFILTIEYKIKKPGNVYYSPTLAASSYPARFNQCGRLWSCYGPNFNPNNPDTWRIPTYTVPPGGFGNVYSCPDCYCFNNPDYSICNFGNDKLKEACTCTDGSVNWVYYCPSIFQSRSSAVPNNIDPCGYDPFSGQPRPFQLITEGSFPTDFWGNCYSFWRLQKPDIDFQPTNQSPPNSGCYAGCTFKLGEVDISNIPNSYSFQFIPDPAIPEQNLANYTPKLQPDLLNFTVRCEWGQQFDPDYSRGYNIQLELGIGYKASFNCGNNVFEIIDIPFKQIDDFIGVYNDGIYVKQNYRRSSLTNDPMNSCVPETKYDYPYTSSNCINSVYPVSNPLNRCYDPQTNSPATLYKDEWSNCLWGPPIPVAGTMDLGLYSADTTVKMNKYCNQSFTEVDWSNHCEYFNLTDDIIVDSN
jgi:hypothetical protein